MTRQFAVFIENRPGSLAEVTRVLSEAGVNIVSVMVEGVHDFGFARIQVSRAREAESALREAGFQFKVTDVLTVRLPNQPGALHGVLTKLAKASINVGSLFGTTGGEEAEVVLDVDDVEGAKAALGIG